MLLNQTIEEIKARQIYTSKGTLTVEVEFCLDGFSIFSSVPAGKSTGKLEAKVILDNDGRSVMNVVNNIIKHSKMILNREICSPTIFDSFLITLDGTKDKSNLGANFTLPLSICYRKFYAYISKVKLGNSIREVNNNPDIYKYPSSFPVAHFNVLNGGLHAYNAINCQEIMVCFERPTFKQQLEDSISFYQTLGKLIEEIYKNSSTGDEGGFSPPFKNIEEALSLILQVSQKLNIKVKIALDLAANSFYKGSGKYLFDGVLYCNEALISLYEKLIKDFPIYSIEDPFAEDDFKSWELFYSKVGDKINIVADDLTVTNVELIGKYKKMFNTVLIKPNQIGTVLETLDAIGLCRECGYKIMISHRSAETDDTFICDLAVGTKADFIKSGAPNSMERIGKYNALLRLDE